MSSWSRRMMAISFWKHPYLSRLFHCAGQSTADIIIENVPFIPLRRERRYHHSTPWCYAVTMFRHNEKLVNEIMPIKLYVTMIFTSACRAVLYCSRMTNRLILMWHMKLQWESYNTRSAPKLFGSYWLNGWLASCSPSSLVERAWMCIGFRFSVYLDMLRVCFVSIIYLFFCNIRASVRSPTYPFLTHHHRFL